MDTTTIGKIVTANTETVKVMNGNSVVWSGEPPYKMGKYLEQKINNDSSAVFQYNNYLLIYFYDLQKLQLKNGDIVTISCDWEKLFTYQGTANGELCGEMCIFFRDRNGNVFSVHFNNRDDKNDKGIHVRNENSNSFIGRKINENTAEMKILNASNMSYIPDSGDVRFYGMKRKLTTAEVMNLVKGCKISILVNGE